VPKLGGNSPCTDTSVSLLKRIPLGKSKDHDRDILSRILRSPLRMPNGDHQALLDCYFTLAIKSVALPCVSYDGISLITHLPSISRRISVGLFPSFSWKAALVLHRGQALRLPAAHRIRPGDQLLVLSYLVVCHVTLSGSCQ
jgi:hypothetical protein